MNILAVDTSGAGASIGIARDENVSSFYVDANESSSSKLLPAIENGLFQSGLDIADIDVFGIGLGPGSYTGLRVGLAVVKGLSFPDCKPLVGFSSLEAIATPVQGFRDILVATKARKSFVYVTLYQRKEDTLEEKDKPQEIPLNQLPAFVSAHTALVGSGIRDDEEELRKTLPNAVTFLPADQDQPKGEVLVKLTRDRAENENYLDASTAEPFYLNPSLAEANRGRTSKKT